MKKKVTLKRIFHRDKWHLAVIFDFDEKLKTIIRSIEGAAYSNTNKCFYIDDTENNLKRILSAIKDVADVDISLLLKKNGEKENKVIQSENGWEERKGPEVIYGGSRDDTGFRGRNDNMQSTEGGRGPKVAKTINAGKTIGNVEFRINEKEGTLVIRFLGRYDPVWIKEMKTYGRCSFDWNRKDWHLQWSRLTCDSLADYFSGQGIEVKISRQLVGQDLLNERKITGEEVRGRPLSEKALNGLDDLAMYLDENRYSPRTRESYLSMLEFFFRYFSEKEPHEITEEEISKFIYDFIIRLGYSPAYQNQMVSAVKTYYTISGQGRVDPEFFERPRRRRSLPKVFSKEEVSRILNSSKNIKHKLLLWIIYSCGLRRSEVTNIRLTDLDRERNLLHIREGKGGVDRIVPVPEKVWAKTDEYLLCYKPRIYLFEGQSGGRYSSESVYRVFKEALNRAGIRKEVGVHSLRHSYATHLHESGLDIRYIQELLGHKSTRTTEIYTHVSRRNLVSVRSPIEDLDVR